MEPGESWAYRARQVDPLVEVVVVRVGTNKPARVLVRFADEEFEGREEWVPPARLKVPWDQVDEFRAREERWDRIHASGPQRDDPLEDAVDEVFQLLIDGELASVGYRDGGAVTITQPQALATRLGLEMNQLTGHPDSFEEEGKVIAPWEITQLIARTAAQRDPQPILQRVASEERKARYEAIHGRYLSTTRGKQNYRSPEHCIEFDAEHLKPRREALRSLCTVEAVERFDELVELRKEVKRVGDVAERAIDALRRAGQNSFAAQLQQELGTPVEMLRLEDGHT